jgi:hypothetical protein
MLLCIEFTGQPILNELRAKKLDTQKMISLNCAAQELPPNPICGLTSIRQELEVDKTLLKANIQENVRLLLKTIFPITCEGLNVTG